MMMFKVFLLPKERRGNGLGGVSAEATVEMAFSSPSHTEGTRGGGKLS